MNDNGIIAVQHYKCGICGLEIDVDETYPDFPYARGWELVEDEIMVELGAKSYWICPYCQMEEV